MVIISSKAATKDASRLVIFGMKLARADDSLIELSLRQNPLPHLIAPDLLLKPAGRACCF